MTLSCLFCNAEVATDYRPYVCLCGAYLGRHGWKKTITVPPKQTHQKANNPEVRRSLYRSIWARLHSAINGDKDFVDLVLGTMPVSCPCKRKADDLLKRFPPRYKSEKDWFEWTVEFHNAVSGELLEQKPQIDMDRAYMLWRNRRPDTGRKRAIVTVANGSSYVEILKLTRPLMQAYADLVNADLIDLDNDTEEWGLMEKFRTFHFATQYEQTLFIDADCVVTDKCPDLFEIYANDDIVIHDDWDMLRKTDWLKRERKAISDLSGLQIKHTHSCLNSGVVLTSKYAADIWSRPSVNIGTSHCAEQIYVAHQIENAVSSGASLSLLDPRANWQWWFSQHETGRFEAGLSNAWIIHFANAPRRLETIRSFLANQQQKCCDGTDSCKAGEQCCRERT